MYLMLAGELAMQRQQYGLAYEAYMELNRRVHDPKFAELAAKLALEIKDADKTNKAVTAWASQEPQNVTVRKVAALSALRGQNKNLAVKELTALLSAEPENFENALLELSSILQKENRGKFIYDVLEMLATKTQSSKAVIYFVQSLLSMQMKNYAQAAKHIEKTLELEPEWEHPLIIQAQLAAIANDFTKTKTLLQSAIQKHPNNFGFKKLLAQTFIKTGEYEQAAEVYQTLITQNAKDGESYIALALLNIQLNKDDNAQTILKTLAEQPEWKVQSDFYLGKIEEKQGHSEAAIALYDQVTNGAFALDAAMSSINLLIKAQKYEDVDTRLSALIKQFPQQKQRIVLTQTSLYNQQNKHEKAFDLLSETLIDLPEDKELLYARALIAEELGKADVLEGDLKKILSKTPDNAQALNALGYTLLQDSKRLQEAKKYLNRAIKLQPNEPAIMDSFGWLQFKLGKPQQALIYLQSAYEKQASGEIAAHLCEVLWTIGHKEEAEQLFEEALKTTPSDAYLEAFKNRFLKP
jgi:tetratricopeptide (TPR) repeat protein